MGLALSNTWGDRHRDAALNEAFVLGEIAVAAELGAQRGLERPVTRERHVLLALRRESIFLVNSLTE